MSTQSTMLTYWPEVTATVRQLERVALKMRPLRDVQHGTAGRAVWVAEIDGRQIGVAWEWAQAANAVAMTDPMTVVTNVVLTDDEGRMLDDEATLLQLNGVIHELCWQDQLIGAQQSTRAARAA